MNDPPNNLLASISASFPAFHPKQLDDGSTKLLKGWFDPRDPRVFGFTSGRVSTYKNKVSGVDAVEYSAAGPAFGTSLNGGPCLVNGTALGLFTTEAALVDLFADASGYGTHTFVGLFQFDTLAISQHLISVGKSTEATAHSATYSQRIGYAWGRTGPASVTTVYETGLGTSTTNPEAVAYRYDGTIGSVRTGGATLSQTLTSGGTNETVVPTRMGIGTHARSTAPVNSVEGKLGPFLLYKGLLSDAECDVACQGLRNWYGLSGL